MRRQLLLVIATATLGVVVAAGTVNAQGGLLGSGQGGVSINVPDGGSLSDLTIDDCPLIEDPQLRQQLGCLESEDGGDSGGDSGSGGGDGGTGSDGGDSGSGGGTDTGGGGGSTGVGGGGGSTGGDGSGATGGQAVAGPGGKGGRGSGGAAGGQQGGDGESKDKKKKGDRGDRKPEGRKAIRTPEGKPTKSNPSLTIAEFGPAPVGVPNFLIDQFAIPPFLLPLYQACGTQYGIPWNVLASVNRIETNFGQNLNVSYAGAVGWMQFMPATWKAYGVDANGDGQADPYNPYDAICSAARYLRASGWENDPRGAIFAYNRADWYVDEVLLYARQYGRLPEDLVGSLTGLTEGARFPVAATARYADDISERRAAQRAKPSKRAVSNAADVISSSPTRRGINIFSREGAPVVAVNDGVITKVGRSKELGRHIVLRDAYGNRFIYAQLGRISDVYPVPKRSRLRARDFELVRPERDPKPSQPASVSGNRSGDDSEASGGPINTEDIRERLYAYPERPRIAGRADLTGQLDALLAERFPGYESFKAYFSGLLRFDRQTMEMRDLKKGSKVIAGTVLGRVGKTSDELAPHLHFAIRPAGEGAPRIDPKPVLDGWKLLEATAIYRAAGRNPFAGSGATTSQVLLMSKPQLIRRVLADPRLEIYACGRDDIRTGQINKRVLAALAYMSERGFQQTVTSLKCGRSSIYTASGGVSHHVSGNAVDVARLNGMPVLGNQGPGSVTEAYVRDLMRLQAAYAPDQIISLMNLGANTFAMGDHADHVHIGYQPQPGEEGFGGRGPNRDFTAVLKGDQWERLIKRLADIDNPSVRTSPSRFALPSKKGKRGNRASNAHIGE